MRHLLSFSILVGLSACATEVVPEELAEGSAALEEAHVVDSVGRDVTLLQAWLGTRITGSDQPPALSGQRFEVAGCIGDDCTAVAEQVLRLPNTEQVSPMIAPFHYINSSGLCEMLELRTVTRQSALDAASFAGLGFFYSSGEPSIGFVPRERLHAVGEVTLRDGAKAVVHRFLAPGMCFGRGGNTGSILARRHELKPYARFSVPETAEAYRVWDDAQSDYLLGRTRDGAGFVSGFDRQEELLH
jgi:hypothetical protein